MKVLYFFLFVFFSGQVFSQDSSEIVRLYFERLSSKGPLSISFIPKTGFLIAHRPYMSHLVKDRNTAFELEFSRQDISRSATSENYRFPSTGFSLHYQDYGYKDVLGSSFGILQFTKFNLIQRKKIGFLDLRVGSGIAYITKEYDVISNPKNNAIGSKWNAFVNFQLVYSKQWKYFLIGAGLEMSHFSNAAMTMPNLGLNTPMCFLKIGYQLAPRQVYTANMNDEIDLPIRSVDKFQFNLIASVKQNLPGYNLSEYLPIIATQVIYKKYLTKKWDFEIGFDLIYNEANRYKYDYLSYTFIQTVQCGLFAGAAASFNKSQIFIGIGSYVYNKINPAGWVYNRIGYRYKFTKNVTALIAIKANIGIADYLELGIGWSL